LAELEPPVIACVLRTFDVRGANDAALVLTAVGIDNRVEQDGADWCLLVPGSLADRARVELERYRAENRPPAPRKTFVPVDRGWFGVAGFLLIIWMLPALESTLALGWDWREIGAMRPEAIRAGEWWRTLTALTLHADLGHIVANSAFGIVFGLFVGRLLGSGIGWLLVVIAGAFGNAIDAAVQGDEFSSIGASTAVFAALGLSAAFVWRRGYYRGIGWRRTAAPMFAAFALLAYTGVGDEHVDVVAHFAGFFCGVISGLVASLAPVERLGVNAQRVAGALAIVIVVAAWFLAGTAHG
jgi:membrane associated rhomboid family serine protease